METLAAGVAGTKPEGRRALTLRAALDALYVAAGALGAAFIALIAMLMVWQSIGREFGVATGAINDIVAWCCAAAAFFTMAHAFKHGDFVRVSLLAERLPPRPKRLLEIVSLLVATGAVAYLAWWACLFTHESWQVGELAQGLLPIPIWIPQSSFALGSILLLVAVADELLIVLRGGVPTYERLVAERHAVGDFSSDL